MKLLIRNLLVLFFVLLLADLSHVGDIAEKGNSINETGGLSLLNADYPIVLDNLNNDGSFAGVNIFRDLIKLPELTPVTLEIERDYYSSRSL